jgi:crotonobetainyl-CoA:carnitine CoA-transferase CaiB-like acyl-CoA transferase
LGAVAFDDQHVACSLWATLDRAHVGRHSMARQPFRIDGRRPPLRTPAPLLGQHTTEVLAELDGAAVADTAPRPEDAP